MEGKRFEPNRGDVRRFHRSNRLAHIIRELPDGLQRLSAELECPSDGRVLDYGSADAPYRHFFAPTVDYIAADLTGNPDATLTIRGDGTLPLPDNSIDVVLSTQVLEHVSDPDLYLRECERVLRVGGRMLLSTHGFMVYRPDPVDLWRWTCEGLRQVVTVAGFNIVRFEGIMGMTATGLQLLQDGILFRLPVCLRSPFVVAMQSAIAIADRWEPPAMRDQNALVFALVAEKRSTVTP